MRTSASGGGGGGGGGGRMELGEEEDGYDEGR